LIPEIENWHNDPGIGRGVFNRIDQIRGDTHVVVDHANPIRVSILKFLQKTSAHWPLAGNY